MYLRALHAAEDLGKAARDGTGLKWHIGRRICLSEATGISYERAKAHCDLSNKPFMIIARSKGMSRSAACRAQNLVRTRRVME
jgi:hypothetical protein